MPAYVICDIVHNEEELEFTCGVMLLPPLAVFPTAPSVRGAKSIQRLTQPLF